MRAGLLLMIVSVCFWCTAAALDSAAEPRTKPLTKEQQEQQSRLLAEFRKARTAPEERLKIIERAGELSPITVRRILEIVSKELRRPLADYRQQFLKLAAQSAAKRTQVANLQEVAELRGTVLALSKQADLTKETIERIGDPALQRLKEIIVLDRAEVLAQNAVLSKKREPLQTLGQQWERCAQLWLQDQSDEQPAGVPNDAGLPDTATASPPSFEQYLIKEEEIAAALAMPMAGSTRAVLAFNAQLANRIDPEEARCVLDLNLTRNLLGLAPVMIDASLTAAARDHSADMESHGFFSHDSPVPGKATPWDRAKRAGTTASAENIAVGTLDGAVANQMWWHSPGHHKNMLGDHKRVGLGRSGKYWTELFGR